MKQYALVVDDEPMIRDFLELTLRRAKITAITAPDGETAVEIYEKDPSKFMLITLDVVMPGIDGLTAYFEMQEIKPTPCTIFLSGYAQPETYKALEHNKEIVFLKKPILAEDFLHKVNQLLLKKLRDEY